MEEARYLSGIAAGLKTKTNKLGFVAAFPIPEIAGLMQPPLGEPDQVSVDAFLYARCAASPSTWPSPPWWRSSA